MPTATRISTKTLQVFVTLQCLDMLTTLIFMRRGVAEGNPLMSWAMMHAHAPWAGLIVSKMLCASLGVFCFRTGRMRLLRRANTGYALVVGWNMLAIVLAVIVP